MWLLIRFQVVAQLAGQVSLSSAHRPELTLEVTCTVRPELRHHAYRFERHLPVLPGTDVKVKDRVIGREGANARAIALKLAPSKKL